MKHKVLNTFFLKYAFSGVFFLFVSCNKDGAGCFDKSGQMVTVVQDLATFTEIDVNSNVNVQILATGDERVEITAGENLVAGINLQIEGNVLKIDNLNSCFLARGYVSPLVTIRSASLKKIVQHGYGKIYSLDTLKVDNLELNMSDASGTFDLLIEANAIRVVSNNVGPINLKGITNSLNIAHYWNDAIFTGEELIAQNCLINHNGSNRIKLNVVDSLTGSVNSIGNVHLYGQRPVIENVDLTSKGQIFEEF